MPQVRWTIQCKQSSGSTGVHSAKQREQAEEESQTDADCVSLIACHGDGKDLLDCDEDMTAAALPPVTDKASSAVRDEMSAAALPPPMTDKADAHHPSTQ